MSKYDLVVKGGTVVTPALGEIKADIGIVGGSIAVILDDLDVVDAAEVVDARGRVVFPGAVDSHYHLGIYQPLQDDVFAETRSSLVGGVTTVLSYFRTGSHYLNRTGSYREILPEVIAMTAGRAHTDFGYHIAPMTPEHVGEIDRLVGEDGVCSMKFYNFYRGLNLSADSTDAASYTMSDNYDLGHLYAIMEAVRRAADAHGHKGRVSLSVHCEEPDLLKLFIDRIRKSGRKQDLVAYHEARPPLQEKIAIESVVSLASVTGCPLNLLHLSSALALEAAVAAVRRFPELDIRLEATLHHLTLVAAEQQGITAKVNPPLRTADDVEALWDGVKRGDIQWVGSDHACTMSAQKGDDLWHALPGFGGTSLMYPVLMSEGFNRRGLSLRRVAELAAGNPARAYGLYPRKGTIAIGSDADLAIVDPALAQVITAERLLSGQDFTPFEGMSLTGWPTTTILGGHVVYRDGQVVGEPRGRFLKRPL